MRGGIQWVTVLRSFDRETGEVVKPSREEELRFCAEPEGELAEPLPGQLDLPGVADE